MVTSTCSGRAARCRSRARPWPAGSTALKERQSRSFGIFCSAATKYSLEEGLKARVPGVKFINWKEFGNTHGADERKILAELPQRLKSLGVDAVISGMGC